MVVGDLQKGVFSNGLGDFGCRDHRDARRNAQPGCDRFLNLGSRIAFGLAGRCEDDVTAVEQGAHILKTKLFNDCAEICHCDPLGAADIDSTEQGYMSNRHFLLSVYQRFIEARALWFFSAHFANSVVASCPTPVF